jgi:hypothetical protein
MKNLVLLIVMFFTTISMNAQSLAGVWNTGEDYTKIEISEDNGVYNGKIHYSDNAKAKIGNLILKDVKFSNGKGEGKIYAAKKGKWYDAILEENGNKLNITIKVGFMSKTLTWEKE